MTIDKRVEMMAIKIANAIDTKGTDEACEIIVDAITQHTQDLMNDLVEKLEKERKPLIHDVNWAEGFNAGVTKSQTIIKSLTENKV